MKAVATAVVVASNFKRMLGEASAVHAGTVASTTVRSITTIWGDAAGGRAVGQRCGRRGRCGCILVLAGFFPVLSDNNEEKWETLQGLDVKRPTRSTIVNVNETSNSEVSRGQGSRRLHKDKGLA